MLFIHSYLFLGIRSQHLSQVHYGVKDGEAVHGYASNRFLVQEGYVLVAIQNIANVIFVTMRIREDISHIALPLLQIKNQTFDLHE